jgi:hypothetical protein
MQLGETVAGYCTNYMRYTNTFCEKNAGFWYVTAGGTYINRWVLKEFRISKPLKIRFTTCAPKTLAIRSMDDRFLKIGS